MISGFSTTSEVVCIAKCLLWVEDVIFDCLDGHPSRQPVAANETKLSRRDDEFSTYGHVEKNK